MKMKPRDKQKYYKQAKKRTCWKCGEAVDIYENYQVIVTQRKTIGLICSKCK